jgi:hypothetical protein
MDSAKATDLVEGRSASEDRDNQVIRDAVGKRPAPSPSCPVPVSSGQLVSQLIQMLSSMPPGNKRIKCTVCYFGAVDTKLMPCGKS